MASQTKGINFFNGCLDVSRSLSESLSVAGCNEYHIHEDTSSDSEEFESEEFEDICINNVRVLAADMVQKAGSGHPGAPMGCAPMAHALWKRIMNYNPNNPDWWNRDRFILSNGHACALMYSMLHLTGYDLSLDDLKNFRQLNSRTPGHPENGMTPGVEVATGPLGQGISNAVGMAICERHLNALFNKPGFAIIDHNVYVICGDGCLQEGVSAESASIAGHLGLGKLIVLWDDNSTTIDGSTELSTSEDVLKRYEAYGWHTSHVLDGSDSRAIEEALKWAKAEVLRPSIIQVTTVIGHGSQKQGTAAVHGSPLGANDIRFLKKQFKMDPEKTFAVKDKVKRYYKERKQAGEGKEEVWKSLFSRYKMLYPELASELQRRMDGRLADGWKEKLLGLNPNTGKLLATRAHSRRALNAIANVLPELMGGCADLTPSCQTWLDCSSSFSSQCPEGRYIRFGVREHAMAAICNGMFAYGGVRPYCATFLQFIGYALGAVRVSSLSRFGVIYVMTHDSIGLGEDGPTHQPVELLEQLRAQPNLVVFRPADGRETYGAYAVALELCQTPSVICLTRQNVPEIRTTAAAKVALGAYIISHSREESSLLDLILIGTGSELALCLQVADQLSRQGKHTRVVSMPSMELFAQQSEDYQREILPDGVPIMSVEAASTGPWKTYSHAQWGIDRFGASAPSSLCLEYFGFSVPNLVKQCKEVMSFYQKIGSVPSLWNRPKLVLGFMEMQRIGR